jgi:hypothetical protein
MKRLLGILALSALTTSLFAQGLVQFNNGQATGPVKQWTSGTDSTAIPVAKTAGGVVNGRVEILTYYNSTTASLTPLFTQVAGGVQAAYPTMGAFLSANPGWVSSATAPIGSLQNGVFNAAVLTLGSSAPGANVSFAIAGWTGSYATWDLAYEANTPANPYASFMGISPVFTTPSGNPLTTPPGSAQSISGIFTGMTLAPVVIPEPTSFALAGLGLAALLVFRRRN